MGAKLHLHLRIFGKGRDQVIEHRSCIGSNERFVQIIIDRQNEDVITGVLEAKVLHVLAIQGVLYTHCAYVLGLGIVIIVTAFTDVDGIIGIDLEWCLVIPFVICEQADLGGDGHAGQGGA